MFIKIPQTQEQKIIDIVNEISSSSENQLEQLIKTHEELFRKIWFPWVGTTQEILDKFGNSSVQLFINSAKTQEYIQALKPNYTPLVPPVMFRINDDGTVTIIE